MKKLLSLVLILVGIGLLGCTSALGIKTTANWVKPGGTIEEFKQDCWDCQNPPNSALKLIPVAGAMIWSSIYNNRFDECMKRKGYEYKEVK